MRRHSGFKCWPLANLLYSKRKLTHLLQSLDQGVSSDMTFHINPNLWVPAGEGYMSNISLQTVPSILNWPLFLPSSPYLAPTPQRCWEPQLLTAHGADPNIPNPLRIAQHNTRPFQRPLLLPRTLQDFPWHEASLASQCTQCGSVMRVPLVVFIYQTLSAGRRSILNVLILSSPTS